MISFKGRLSFLQYMPKKPVKWGMKAWALADSTSGYTWNFKLYTGKGDGSEGEGTLGEKVVMELSNSLQHKGHHLYTDNYYTCPSLCHKLYNVGIGSCGTSKINRVGIPKDFQAYKLQPGEMKSYKDGPVTGLKWFDKRVVVALSTLHDESWTTVSRRSRLAPGGTETISKPNMIDQYNKYMGGVDKADQLVQYYSFQHYSKKWWKRVFFHLLDLCLVNAYIVYTTTQTTHMSHMDFRLAVAADLIARSQAIVPDVPREASHLPVRLIGRDHFPEPGSKRDCRVCSRRDMKRKQTNYQCNTCKTPLCVHPCFRQYHTQKNYK